MEGTIYNWFKIEMGKRGRPGGADDSSRGDNVSCGESTTNSIGKPVGSRDTAWRYRRCATHLSIQLKESSIVFRPYRFGGRHALILPGKDAPGVL